MFLACLRVGKFIFVLQMVWNSLYKNYYVGYNNWNDFNFFMWVTPILLKDTQNYIENFCKYFRLEQILLQCNNTKKFHQVVRF